MPSDLPVLRPADSAADLLTDLPSEYREGLEAGLDMVETANAASTRDVYQRAFDLFVAWCASQGKSALPADSATVLAYVGVLREKRNLGASRLGVVVSAIAWKHQETNHLDPTAHAFIARALKQARREDAAVRPAKKSHALTGEIPGLRNELAAVIDAIAGDDLVAIRDRALLLLFWSGAFRRSEVASLTLANLHWRPAGLWIPARVSKGDQEGKGAAQGKGKAILLADNPAHCPVVATRLWCKVLDQVTGREVSAGVDEVGTLPVFVGFRPGEAIRDAGGAVIGRQMIPRNRSITGQAVNTIIKARAAAAGFDAKKISSHGLRRGWLTTAAENGLDVFAMQGQSNHKSVEMLSEYVGVVDAFRRLEGKKLL